MTSPLLLSVALAASLVIGCSDKTEPTVTGSSERRAASDAPSTSGDAQVQVADMGGNANSVLVAPASQDAELMRVATPAHVRTMASLTGALRQFVQQRKRMPNNVAELVSSQMDSAPQAPPGYVYVIDEKRMEVHITRKK